MALIVADRVQETCISPGVGAVTLLGAVFQFQTFSSAIGNANTTLYVIADQFGVNWEVGIGTYASAGNTLTRTTVLSSSNGGALVNFSSGTQNVWNDYPAEYAIYASNNASQANGQSLISGGVGVAPAWGNPVAPSGSPGYYGQFYDTTIQTATSASVAYLVGCALTSISNGVSISAGRITVANAGIYNFQFSIQLANPTAGIAETTFWVRYNGVDIADSASTTGVPIKHGGINGEMILSLNQVFNMAAGDYLELWWHSNVAGVLIETLPATTVPIVPQSPGVIFTMLQQAQIGIGYNGLTSATSTLIGTGSKTFTTNLTNSQTAFVVGTRVRVAYSVTPADFMEGVVTAFSGTTFTVNVDSIGGSGTFASWTISVAGIQGSNGVTSFSGNTTGLTPSTPTTGAITLGGTLAVANGGTNASTASITSFNNITGYTATGATGTTSTNLVFSTSPTLVTPALGTPSALVGTNITGTATAFTASNVTTNANLTGAVTSVGNTSSLGSFTSLQLLTALTNETGTGAAVFATSPTLVTPALGTPSSGTLTNCTFPTLNQNTTGSSASCTGNATGSTFGFNSGYGSVATAYGCRAWVNFNGTGTVAIRDSGNVSSITDLGTGLYTANFATAMPDANYAAVPQGSAGATASGNNPTTIDSVNAPTASGVTIRNRSSGGNQGDPTYVTLAVFR